MDFAKFLIFITVAVGLSVAFTCGINRVLVRKLKTFLPQGEMNLAASAIAEAVWVFALIAPLLFGCLILAFESAPTFLSLPALPSRLILLVVALGGGLAMQQILAETFRALDRVALASLYAGPTGGPLFVIVVLLGLLTSRSAAASLEQALLVQAIAAWAILAPGVVLAAYACRTTFRAVPLAWVDLALSKRRLREFPEYIVVMITQVMFFACTQIDQWVAAFAIAPAELANYTSPRRLVMLTSAPLQLLNMTVATTIPEYLAVGRRSDLQTLLQKSALVGLAASGCVLLVFLIMPQAILSFVYGPGFAGGANVLQILSIAQLFNSWTGACGIVLMMSGRQRIVLIVNALMAVGVVSLSLFFQPLVPVSLAIFAAMGIVGQYCALWLMTKRSVGIWTHAQGRSRAGRVETTSKHGRPSGG